VTAAEDRAKQDQGDIAALAKGGRQNFVGFLVRLVGMLPFLFIAGRLYGAAALGRYASALVVVEITGLICSMGEKRGLAQRLTEDTESHPANIVFDGMLIATVAGLAAAALFWLVPAPMFPSGTPGYLERLIVLAIPAYALTEIVLAAQAYRFDIATTVRARSIVLPWTLSIAAGALWFVLPESPTHGKEAGLMLAYLASTYAGLATGLFAFLKTYGLPRLWRPRPRAMAQLTVRALPLATADAIEWGTRRLDIFILGLFAAPSAVGVYYVAQQVASLPQKLKTSFEPILGPVITRNLKDKNYAAIAKQVCQVGFWITAAQAGIALALGIPGEAVMGLVGPHFVGGTGALAFLLAAEVVAATAVVSEAALIYVARVRNLIISLSTIGLQALLTVAAMIAVERLHLPENFKAAGAAAALMVSLGVASLVKSRVLARILNERINNWRWALVIAGAPAIIMGWLATKLPEWAELIVGVPAILLAYSWVIWRYGFGPEDRVLFRRNLEHADDELDREADEVSRPPVKG
jgi:O-antigen/teichoic acid export membrane protein